VKLSLSTLDMYWIATTFWIGKEISLFYSIETIKQNILQNNLFPLPTMELIKADNIVQCTPAKALKTLLFSKRFFFSRNVFNCFNFFIYKKQSSLSILKIISNLSMVLVIKIYLYIMKNANRISQLQLP
jgi:hypothetical protein